MQKLYCYVDESGQDTEGKLFFVSVVITSSEREEFEKRLRDIEGESKKNVRKWTRATRGGGVKARKVRGLRDESNEFIRLADALVGFTRDALEGDKIMKSFYERAMQKNVIHEV